jgi:hypothetical protein
MRLFLYNQLSVNAILHYLSFLLQCLNIIETVLHHSSSICLYLGCPACHPACCNWQVTNARPGDTEAVSHCICSHQEPSALGSAPPVAIIVLLDDSL